MPNARRGVGKPVVANRPGNCFEVALKLAEEIGEQNNPLVCHGLPLGNGPQNMGQRFWHAWVEMILPGGPTVFDFSNGLEVVMKRAQYYRGGRIIGDAVHRYSLVDARRTALENGHYGPWVPDWSDECDVYSL